MESTSITQNRTGLIALLSCAAISVWAFAAVATAQAAAL